jgi:hypothetical protein
MRQMDSAKRTKVTYAVGAEYSYQDSFAMRLGYFHESPSKGEQFFSWTGLNTMCKVMSPIYFQLQK